MGMEAKTTAATGERMRWYELPEEVAFFVAKRIRSNVRELEGAMRRVLATARFTGRAVTLELAREALKDLLARPTREEA